VKKKWRKRDRWKHTWCELEWEANKRGRRGTRKQLEWEAQARGKKNKTRIIWFLLPNHPLQTLPRSNLSFLSASSFPEKTSFTHTTHSFWANSSRRLKIVTLGFDIFKENLKWHYFETEGLLLFNLGWYFLTAGKNFVISVFLI